MFEPLTPEHSGLKRLRNYGQTQTPNTIFLSPLTGTPSTETINWTLTAKRKSKRFMEQASTVTQWKLSHSLKLESIQNLFQNSEIKKGSLFIKGTNNSVPAARIFSSGTLTCASCSHSLNIKRGNEIIYILKQHGHKITPVYKGDCASTYNGHFFMKGIKSDRKKRKTSSGVTIKLSNLRTLLSNNTQLFSSYNPELQNCLVVSLPNNVMIDWSKENHYQFSDSFHEIVKTLLLVNRRLFQEKIKTSQYLSNLSSADLNLEYTNSVDATLVLIKWLALSEQKTQMEQGEFEKQGTLRIYNTGSVTALGVKNCELLQNMVERIDKLIKDNIDELQ
jgi:TATA-box binding protein (TBP) (component of TFIID and TFIIIB)